MATYNDIANSEVDPESPITSSLMTRLRDNTLAIQQGDPTAPKIVTDALAAAAVTAEKLNPDTVEVTLGTQKGTIILNGRLYINWILFPNVPADDTNVQDTWQTPFPNGRYFSLCSVESGVNPAPTSPLVIQFISDTTCRVQFNGTGAETTRGYAIAVGH